MQDGSGPPRSVRSDMTGWDEMAVVGRVARAHGNRGQVIVDPETDFPVERFKPGSVMYSRDKGGAIESFTVESARFHRGRPIIGLADVATMDAAESLAGREFRVGLDALQSLPPGSFYHHDLVGCAVETSRGEAVGLVARVDGDATASRLVVQSRGGEVLIPLADGICIDVDLSARKVVIEPLEGLLDLNVTRTKSPV